MSRLDLAQSIWHNEVIFAATIPFLSPTSLHTISQTCRRAWAHAIPQLWSVLRPEHIKSFRLVSLTAGSPLLIPVRGCSCYGELVKEIRLSMLAGRWDRVDYLHMFALLEPCINLRVLDMNMCANMRSSEFSSLFTRSLTMCRSLEYLDICETGFSVQAIASVIGLMPNLKHLDISDTDTDDDLLAVISKRNTKLTYLAVAGCINVSNVGIKDIVAACKQLKMIDIAECPYIDDLEFLKANNIELEMDPERSSDSYAYPLIH